MTSETIKEINLRSVERDGYISQLDEVACPHCGAEWESTYDDYEDSPYENHESQCPECEEYFYLSCVPEVQFCYTSTKEEAAE